MREFFILFNHQPQRTPQHSTKQNKPIHVLTRIHFRPSSATTSTFIPPGWALPAAAFFFFLPSGGSNIRPMAIMGGGANNISFHTATKYGAFVDNSDP
jgi:hypothetical protein